MMMTIRDNIKILCSIVGVLTYGLPLLLNSVFLDEFYGVGTPLILGLYFTVDSFPINSLRKGFTLSAGVFFLGLFLILAYDTIIDELFKTYWWVVGNFIITVICFLYLAFRNGFTRH